MSCLVVFFSLCIPFVFLIMFYMSFISLLILTVIINQQVLLFHIHANIDKDANNAFYKIVLFFSVSFLFFKIWFNKNFVVTYR